MYVIIKPTLKGELSSSPTSSFGSASGYEAQGCRLQYHCGQELFILYFFFFAFNALLAGRTSPYK